MDAGWRCLVFIFIVIIYPIVGRMFVLGWRVFYISEKSVSSQCQVRSVDLNRYDDTAEGVWNVTVMNGNQRKNGLVKGMLSWNFDKQAWINAENYEVQINQTYTCYGPPLNKKLLFVWNWRWEKPKNRTGYYLLLSAAAIFLLATSPLVYFLCRRFSTKPNRQYQRAPQEKLINEEQFQITPYVQT